MNTTTEEQTKTKSFAEVELEILLKQTPDALIKDFTPEILAICKAFEKSGQSGSSAPYVAGALANTINNLCLHQAISPMVGDDAEFIEVGTDKEGKKIFQNTRCSAIFKEEGGNAYYLNAVIFKDQNKNTWTGVAKTKEGKEVFSRQFVKSFPFEPLKFFIDVEEIKSENGNDFILVDDKQLDGVFNYYNEFTAPEEK